MNMAELKRELTIFPMIPIVFIIRKNGNQLHQLEEWIFREKKMVK